MSVFLELLQDKGEIGELGVGAEERLSSWEKDVHVFFETTSWKSDCLIQTSCVCQAGVVANR